MDISNNKMPDEGKPTGLKDYNFQHIEKKWQQWWKEKGIYKVSNDSSKPKYYVLDMFPYPSGAGLHVGHPLGYIASDIYSRYKRLKGYNVLHPMGFDAFGLPAEQYAIEHGIHPAISTEANIRNFKNQLEKIGFCYDWDREINTSKPEYYKWTQWIFLQLYNSYYDKEQQKARPIVELEKYFMNHGSLPSTENHEAFTAEEWKGFDEKKKQEILMNYRLAYSAYGEVNWCEALGTVLANDEVVNGVSERGGHPVEKRKMRQWFLRITAYADRLLEGLKTVDFSEAMKEMQTNWIGRSSGAEIDFEVRIPSRQYTETEIKAPKLKVFTTRPDTIFGVDFMVLAPEHELVEKITTPDNKKAVDEYLKYVKSRSERERMADKTITGIFTGSYAINPFNGREIPIWISEYVLAGYGTGAIMAVPCSDERDHKFATHFNIPVTNIIGKYYNGKEANPTKEAILENSGFLNGRVMKDAIEVAIRAIEEKGVGKRKVYYKMRDAGFSRQRYWGEPFPITWKDGVPYALDESKLPIILPYMQEIKPGKDGEGPLSNNEEWLTSPLFEGGRGETSTMPGYAGSSWYFLRYMDPKNENEFCSRRASDYWGQVDVYVGGTEHAVGHLLYSRMWTKVLYDLGYIGFDEPFKKLVNQGMIQGSSRFVYRIHGTNTFVSKGKLLGEKEWDHTKYDKIHVDINLVDGVELNIEEFKKWKGGEFANADFILENGKYICGVEIEKMSKSRFNTVNPDDIVAKYGADTFRMYEMFLGPLEMSKPWDTRGIEGVHRFLKKFWRLFVNEQTGTLWPDLACSATKKNGIAEPTPEELKVLHNTIKKIENDTERFSFNTAVSNFMIATNELTELKCHKRKILEPLLILLAPYAPHIAEELWSLLGNTGSIMDASYPVFEEKYINESTKTYPVAINGKVRTELTLDLNATQQQAEEKVLANEVIKKWLNGKTPKKIIYVKSKMINVVV